MNPTKFILKNINQLSSQDGFSEQIVPASANKGVAEYTNDILVHNKNGEFLITI